MAENKQNPPNDKKTVPANETTNNEKTNPTDKFVKNDGKVADNVVVLPVKNKEQEKPKGKETTKSVQDKKDTVKPTSTEKKPIPDKKPEEKQRREARPPTGVKEEPKTSEPEKPMEPREANRPVEKEEIIFIKLSELHPFKNHPFSVLNNEEMRAMVESVKDKGVTHPAIVRPIDGGGYEIVSGHRRQKASELAGIIDMPCIVRKLTDEQAITQMVEDNTNQRDKILPSEKAKALKMQLDAIKRQGVRDSNNGKRSNEIVAERNNMTVKQVQRYIKLNELVPELLKLADEDKLKFTPAVELAFVSRKNQQYIAVAIESQESTPNLSQAQKLRELDQDKKLNPDVIDGIMLGEKKEVEKVIISTQELSKFFGKETPPREMKDHIMKLLENDLKAKEINMPAPEKKSNQPEK